MAAKLLPAALTSSTPWLISRIALSIAPTTLPILPWFLSTRSLIWWAAASDCSASLRTSSATTAKPRPCSPARAASMAAFSANRLVCPAIVEIRPTISPIWAELVFSSSAATCACLEPVLTAPIWLTAVSIEVLPSSAALAVWVDSVAISPAVAATSCIVAEISSTIAEVSLTAPTCFSLPIATCWIDWATLLAASADCWALAVSCSDEAATCSADWEICFSRPRMLWVRLLIATDSLPTSSLRRSSSGGTLAVKLPAAN